MKIDSDTYNKMSLVLREISSLPVVRVVQVRFDEREVSFSVSTGEGKYAEAVSIMRELGIHFWHKEVTKYVRWVYSELSGFRLSIFFNDLPPTCRIERVKKLVPRTEIKETGDFVEIEEVKIVCGDQNDFPTGTPYS